MQREKADVKGSDSARERRQERKTEKGKTKAKGEDELARGWVTLDL